MANSRNSRNSKNINPTVIVIIIIIILLLGGIGYLIYRIIKKKEENHIYIDNEEDNYEYEEVDDTPQNLKEPYMYNEEEERALCYHLK